LLALAWTFRRAALVVLAVQSALLALGLAGLACAGLAVDALRYALDASAPPPRGPFGLAPPPGLRPLALVFGLAGLVAAAAALRSVLSYAHAVALGRLLQLDLVPRLRAEVYDKLQRLDFRFFDAHASGSIINRVTGDVQAVRSFLDGVAIQGVVLTLSLAVFLGYMVDKHAGLTAACLATAPLLAVGTSVFSRRVQPLYAESRRLADELLVTLSENVQGLAVWRGFGREDHALARFAARNRALRDQQRAIFLRVSLFTPAMSLGGHVNLLVLIAYGGTLAATGRLSLGDLVVFAGLLQQVGAQVTGLATVVNTLQQSLIGARRVFEVLDADVGVESAPGALRPAAFAGRVRLEGVSFAYRPGAPVLEGIDLDVPAGTRVAILGETGAGKTTLLSLIPRFYDPAAGRVLVDEVDVRRLDLAHLRRHVGVVFQESFLFSDTIVANIAFGHPEAPRDAIERAACLARAHDFVAALPHGYDTRIGEGGKNLSGGQRQRLALARALLPGPSILLLDDPASALDPETERDLFDALEAAMQGRTTFIIAHRPSTLRRADLVLVLEDGRIVQRGTPAELARDGGGPYRRALKAQIHEPEAAAAPEVRP
jgi:ATP-binding cassette subfamily B protein